MSMLFTLESCNAKSKINTEVSDTVKLKDFLWYCVFEGGNSSSNVEIICINKVLLLKEYDFRLGNEPVNRFEIDSLGNKIVTTKNFDINGLYASSYLKSEDTVIQYPTTYHQIRTYHIPLTDSTIIKKMDLKYTRECPRGCDSKSSIIAYFDDKTLELKFTRNMTIGSMHIHDIVQYDATSFVISFWYYKRGGGEWISDVRVGLLDLKQYLLVGCDL